MATSDALASRVERACLAQVEAWVLADRVGETFRAVVLHAEANGAVRCSWRIRRWCPGASGTKLPEGERIEVRLTAEADPVRRKVTFVPA